MARAIAPRGDHGRAAQSSRLPTSFSAYIGAGTALLHMSHDCAYHGCLSLNVGAANMQSNDVGR